MRGATVSVSSTCGWSFTVRPVRRMPSTRARASSPGIVRPSDDAARMPLVKDPMPANTPSSVPIANAMLDTIV